MGRTHYIYMNGSSGCMPDTLDLCFSIDEAVGMFETIFGDDLYENLNQILADFRDSGYVSLGPDYGADYASWSPCSCDSPWEHSELSMEQWIREHGDVWFTEEFEVKVRYEGDNRPWEEIEAFECATSERSEYDLEESIYKFFISNDRRRVVEVRWNWVGDSQGHYFVPEYKEAA